LKLHPGVRERGKSPKGSPTVGAVHEGKKKRRHKKMAF